MRALIDTNVLLSAALRDRLPERVVIFVATQNDWKWIVTADILDEYINVLRRPKFKLPEDLVQQWTNLISMRTVNAGTPSIAPKFLRDPKDLPFLAAALFHQANYLITGDKDLLDIRDSIDTRIVTVAQFASEIGIS